MENSNVTITQSEFEYSQEVIGKLSAYYDSCVVGQQHLKMSLIEAVIADGHILIESVPGLAKTTAAKAIANSLNGKFSRIQCTPDLLPGDIIGSQIYNQATGKFDTIFGPVFANFVLLDEVNRSSAKTQSAMLEAMQEKQVTIGGVTYKMPEDIFIVIATQNPIEQEGTYPLSEAQTDRFMLKEIVDYPTPEDEVEILTRTERHLFENQPAVLTIQDVDRVQDICDKVYIDDAVKKYIARIVDATRHADKVLKPEMAQYVRLGASPRATLAFMELSKAKALILGRTYVTPEDIRSLSHEVLRHRLSLNYSAIADGVKVETIIDAIIATVIAP